jgi:hypothetical protein
MSLVVWFVLAMSVVGTGYQLFQLVAAAAFFRRARRRDARAKDYRPPVTILKPLKGPGIDLYANLASFCRQDYPRFQIVCGVNDPSDPAIEIVRRIQREFPHCDVVLSVGDRSGANRKVANLVHMMEHAKYDVLALSDADVRVRQAIATDHSNLLRSNGSRSPFFFTTVRSRSCTRSKVVKRAPHASHCRRRRIAAPSSDGRLSFTWLSSWAQKGQRISYR